jgi:addiction module HigA family antidote
MNGTTHPGEYLFEEFLQPLQISQADLARALGIPLNRVNELVKGKRGMTAETAILLSQYFGTSAQLWMNLQAMHDLT